MIAADTMPGTDGYTAPPPPPPAQSTVAHPRHHHRHAPRQSMTSLEANARINAALRTTYEKYCPGGAKSTSASQLALRITQHLMQAHLTAMLTVCALVAAAMVTPVYNSVPLALSITFSLVYGALLALEAFHLAARSVEMRRRMLNALEDFVAPSPATPPRLAAPNPAEVARAVVVPPDPSTASAPTQPKYAFHGTFAGLRGLLPCRSFHLRQVFRDGKYVAMPKALIVEGDDVLVPRLALSRHNEEHRLTNAGSRAPRDSALTLTVKAVLEKSAIQLPQLSPSVLALAFASPYRTQTTLAPVRPSVAPPSTTTTLCDTTSEGSAEGEDEPRSTALPESPATPTEQMEYFVHRALCVVWLIAFPFLLIVCALYRGHGDTRFWEHVLVEPSVALLGLLPFNAIVVSRGWSLWSNLVLISRLRWLLRRADDDSSDDENVDSGAVVFEVAEGRHDTWRVLRSLVRMLRVDGSAPYLCFSRSPVHALGSATVLASLDGEATLTEAVPVPLRLLYIKSRPLEDSSAPHTGETTAAAVPTEDVVTLHPDLQALLEKQNSEAEAFRRAQKYGTERFQVLELHHSSNKSKVVTFVDPKVLAPGESAGSTLLPMGLCALLHSVHGTSALRGRDAPRSRDFVACQAMDATVMWGRCMHWLSRAMEIPDPVAVGFRLRRRMLFIDRAAARRATAHTSRPIPQKCGLLFEAPTGELHLYVIGTLAYVLEGCASCWDGGGVGALSEQDRHTTFTLTARWPISADVVGCSFRVLPERYREFLLPPDPPPAAVPTPAAPGPQSRVKMAPCEDFYIDGRVVFSTHPAPPESDPHRANGPHLGGHRHVRRRAGGLAGDGDDATSSLFNTPQVSPAAIPADAPVTRMEKDNVPSFEPDSDLSMSNAVQLVMSCQQTFLGATGLYDFVRPRVEDSIRTLNTAGVRFVHFGSGTLQEVRSFGSRLGLKNEHNNCISLREHDPSIDDAYIRARLPRGVDSIRRHLVSTDTVPLKVPMFCGARSTRTRNMISVMQDNHEVVIAVGSPFNHSNVRAMLQADISIAAEPSLKRGAAVDGDDIANRQIDEMFFHPDPDTAMKLQHINRLISPVCALKLTPTTQTLPMVVALIRQARLLLKQLAQATDFIVQCSVAITLMQAFMLCINGGPLMLPPSLTLVILNITVPILAFGVAYTPLDVNVMKLLPTKIDYASRVAMARRWAKWFAIKFIPSCIAIIGVSVVARSSIGTAQMAPFHQSGNLYSSDTAVAACAAFSTLSIAYIFVWISMTFLSRHEFVPIFILDRERRAKVRYALSCRRWLICCGAGFSINILSVLIVTTYDELLLMLQIPWWCFAFVLIWPSLVVALDLPLKRRRAAVFHFEQRMLDLAFQTRLGMYSPVGSEDAGLDEARHSQPTQLRTENCLSSAIRSFLSIDGGKSERQCVCRLWTDA